MKKTIRIAVFALAVFLAGCGAETKTQQEDTTELVQMQDVEKKEEKQDKVSGLEEIFWSDDMVIEFTDEEMEGAVRYNTGIDERNENGEYERKITYGDVKNLEEFKDGLFYYEDISEIKYLTSLKSAVLPLKLESVSGVENLAYLKNLEELTLSIKGEPEDLSVLKVLAELPNLKRLNFALNSEVPLSFLTSLQQVTELKLTGDGIIDISSVSEMKQLEKLTVWCDDVTDISAVSELENLAVLDVRTKNLSDISPVAELKNVRQLTFWSETLEDISPISGMQSLKQLYLYCHSLADFSPIYTLENLHTVNITSRYVTEEDEQRFKEMPSMKWVTYLTIER